MNELGTALREAGDAVGPLRPVDPADLWRQGKRRVRRRRLAGAGALAAVSAIVVGFVVAGPGLVRPNAAMPAAGVHDPALPRNVYDPPAWLPSTQDEGPLGQVAVLGMLATDDELEPFGISATTGEYRRLELPDRVPGTGVALSPDGRSIAYWIAGPVTGDVRDEQTIGGFAVYDAEGGSFTSHLVESERGLAAGRNGPDLLWLDSSELLASYGLLSADGQRSTGMRTYRWSPRESTPDLDHAANAQAVVRLQDGSLLAWADEAARQVQSLDHEFRPTASFVLPEGRFEELTRRGALVVASGALATGDRRGLLAGTVSNGGRADLKPVHVPLTIARIHGWTSGTEVLVSAWQSPDTIGQPDLYEVDVVRGAMTLLGAAGDDYDSIVAFTQDLLEQPMVEGLHPDFGPNPLFLRLGVAGVVLGGSLLAAFLLWRRRARP